MIQPNSLFSRIFHSYELAKLSRDIKLTAFDWSGVISDDRMPVYLANMELLKMYGKSTMSFEEWLPRTTLTPVEFMKNHSVSDNPDKIFGLHARFYSNIVKSGTKPSVYPDAEEIFDYLNSKGMEVVVLSSHPKANLKKDAKGYKLNRYIDSIFGSSKDKTKGLLDICSMKNKEPQSVLYTGDTIYDIQAAKQAGVVSAGICDGYHTRKRLGRENPSLLMSCLSDLKRVV